MTRYDGGADYVHIHKLFIQDNFIIPVHFTRFRGDIRKKSDSFFDNGNVLRVVTFNQVAVAGSPLSINVGVFDDSLKLINKLTIYNNG